MKKGKQESQGRATSRSRSQSLIPGGREKVTQINVCIANKCMISTNTSFLFTNKGDQNAKRTEEPHRQRAGQDQNEAPRSVNYRATQNKINIGTTA